MNKSDPIRCLMDNTVAGHCSEMLYSKVGDDTMPYRRVIPRTLVDRSGELEVRCVQLVPENGLRTFKASRIVEVTRSVHLLSHRERETNTFATGQIKVATPPEGLTIVFSLDSEHAPTQAVPRRSVWMESWFREYAAIVRDCLSDMKLTNLEVATVKRFQQRHGLSSDQVSAVHAYILGEELIGLASDGQLAANEVQYLDLLREQLNVLGSQLFT